MAWVAHAGTAWYESQIENNQSWIQATTWLLFLAWGALPEKLSTLQEIITSFKLNSAIEEFEMIGFEIDVDGFCFENVLETFTETFPKLKRLCLTADIDDDDLSQWDPYAEFCQEFASENNIKLEFQRLDVRDFL